MHTFFYYLPIVLTFAGLQACTDAATGRSSSSGNADAPCDAVWIKKNNGERYARGTQEAVKVGFELEGSISEKAWNGIQTGGNAIYQEPAFAIFNFYRHKNLSEDEWLTLSSQQRIDYFLDTLDPYTMAPDPRSRQHAKSGVWTDFELLSQDAVSSRIPPLLYGYMETKLAAERPHIWELRTRPISNISHLLLLATALSAELGRAFHLHLSVPAEGLEVTHSQLANLWAQGNEFATFSAIAENPANATRQQLMMKPVDYINAIDDILRDSGSIPAESQSEYRLMALGARRWIVNGKVWFGLELRAIADLQKKFSLLGTLIDVLEDPSRAFSFSGSERAYYLSDLEGVARLERQNNDFPSDLTPRLIDAKEFVSQLRAPLEEPRDQEVLVSLWQSPYIDYTRQHIPLDTRQRIRTMRAVYADRLRHAPKDSLPLTLELTEALHDWVVATGLLFSY